MVLNCLAIQKEFMHTSQTGTTDKHGLTGHRVPPFSMCTVVYLIYNIRG